MAGPQPTQPSVIFAESDTTLDIPSENVTGPSALEFLIPDSFLIAWPIWTDMDGMESLVLEKC